MFTSDDMIALGRAPDETGVGGVREMIPSPFSPYGSPDDDSGSTVSVEIDTMLKDLAEYDCQRLLRCADTDGARIDETALLQTRVVFELPGTGWLESG